MGWGVGGGQPSETNQKSTPAKQMGDMKESSGGQKASQVQSRASDEGAARRPGIPLRVWELTEDQGQIHVRQ